MNNCLKPHAVLHTIFGIGLGVVLASYFKSFTGIDGMMVGFALMLTGFVGEFGLPSKSKK